MALDKAGFVLLVGTKVDYTHMVQVITLQTFDGSWDMSKELADVTGQSLVHLTDQSPTDVSIYNETCEKKCSSKDKPPNNDCSLNTFLYLSFVLKNKRMHTLAIISK